MVATVGADFLLVRQESIRNIDSGEEQSWMRLHRGESQVPSRRLFFSEIPV